MSFFAFIDSGRRAGANPFVFLTDVLNRLPGLPADQLEELDELLPDNW